MAVNLVDDIDRRWERGRLALIGCTRVRQIRCSFRQQEAQPSQTDCAPFRIIREFY